jgi:hypothetical protein
MKSKTKAGILRFSLNLLHYGNSYLIERVAGLEQALAKKPRRLQIDMLGEGEIEADWALLIRDILNQRSPKTRVITNARSSLQNGSVLVWLLGDQRIIRADAQVFFRKANVSEETEDVTAKVWNEEELKYSDSESDPEETGHAKVLQLIDEFLPVKELAGKVIDVAALRQFGLVENEKFDRFLATAFGQSLKHDGNPAGEPKPKRARTGNKSSQSTQAQK